MMIGAVRAVNCVGLKNRGLIFCNRSSNCADVTVTLTKRTSCFKIRQLLSISVQLVQELYRAALCRIWTVAQGNKILYSCATFSMGKTES